MNMRGEPGPIVNIAAIPLETDSQGTRFEIRRGEVGEARGFGVLGCMLHVPERSACALAQGVSILKIAHSRRGAGLRLQIIGTVKSDARD